jgi:hypothetical protein
VELATLDLQRNCGHADVRRLFDLTHQSSWRPRQWWVYRQHVEYRETLGLQYVREQLMHYTCLGDMSFSEWLISHMDWKAGAAVLGLGVLNLFIQGLSQAFKGPDIQGFCKIPVISEGLSRWMWVLSTWRCLKAKTYVFLRDVQHLFYRNVLFDLEVFGHNVKYLIDHIYIYPVSIMLVTALVETYNRLH